MAQQKSWYEQKIEDLGNSKKRLLEGLYALLALPDHAEHHDQIRKDIQVIWDNSSIQ